MRSETHRNHAIQSEGIIIVHQGERRLDPVFDQITHCFNLGHTATRRGIPRPSDRNVSVHRRPRAIHPGQLGCCHGDADSPHLSSTARTGYTTTSTDDPGRHRRGIPDPFLDGRGYDGRVYQPQRRSGARHVAVADSPAVHQSVIPPLSRVVFLRLTVLTGMEYPYVTALLQDQTILVHSVESQDIVQEIPPDPLPVSNEADLAAMLGAERRALAMSSNGFLVPSQGQPEKLRLRQVNFLNRNAKPGGREVVPTIPAGDNEETQEDLTVTESETETGASAPPYEV